MDFISTQGPGAGSERLRRVSASGGALAAATALSTGAAATVAVQSDAPRDRHWLARNVPCRSACPAGTDIPAYLEAIHQDRHEDAYRINLRDNVFPGILGRVCARPCEDACRHAWPGNGEPVAICHAKRAAADLIAAAPVVLAPLFPPSGRRVAVVGAGVAGLAAARDLALFGHAVTVYERHSHPGGMLNQGIPAFRLPRDLVEREVAQVLAQGVQLRCGVEVGRDLAIDTLMSDHDAVVLAAGTLRPVVPRVPGADAPGAGHGLDFLLAVNEGGSRTVGRRVVVVGGGYTAMDCARVALRLGAAVTVCYRRGREDMVVLPGELEEALAEGAALRTGVLPVAVVLSGGRVAGLRLVRTEAVPDAGSGRRGFREIPGSEFDMEADQVIWATGQSPDTAWVSGPAAARVGPEGRMSDTADGSKLFVAGDFALGATSLIQAIGHARACARRVDAFLMGSRRLQEAVRIGPVLEPTRSGGCGTGRAAALNERPLRVIPVLPLPARSLEAEVETGYDRDAAREAASRCYLCHYKFEIVDSRCVLCDECLKVKPVDGCIVEISALVEDVEGRVQGLERLRPGEADSLYYNRLWIDQNQCVRCGRCETVCPTGAITLQKVDLLELAGDRPAAG